jgi:hypothetical protein
MTDMDGVEGAAENAYFHHSTKPLNCDENRQHDCATLRRGDVAKENL